ncbi:hypothetical protein [Sinorhizobium meliloti]|uniref:Uncharacterized protein n=1 Tax=Sinorhizobium meliloti (strain SM11) TaxID=707241 RepID=F7XE55_SINMM|nr:hypothetical protein [Sinorhizobium meliloti]AEH81830.1 hypothetical protein SM11_pC0757 [Sinorhizobium meliloti SM11]MCM5689535.1 hypothetical protein [Sinorhizobium meliloti]WKL24637.1 hypothetical protein Q1M63_04645 [Sinorhizobium meliloti]WKL38924.1 hypothetical protein Q1M64_04120 [Sinorhizobium meliloti]WQO38340.1 hypothetical protein U8C34_03180 [Sinorhizobium meliloti]
MAVAIGGALKIVYDLLWLMQFPAVEAAGGMLTRAAAANPFSTDENLTHCDDY